MGSIEWYPLEGCSLVIQLGSWTRGAGKLEIALEGPVPWSVAPATRAGETGKDRCWGRPEEVSEEGKAKKSG